MIEGPTIGEWTQYGWIPDEVSSFPARVRLRDAAWMVYYEANVGDERERAERLELQAENAKLRMLCADMWEAIKTHKRINFAQLLRFGERVSELGVEAPS